MIIGYDTFRDEEYFIPKSIFEKAGYNVTTACAHRNAKSKIKGEIVTADILTDQTCENGFDALVLVGGEGAKVYFDDKKIHQLAWDFYGNEKLVTAICIAPVILSKAGLLVGKHATVWPGAKQELCEGTCLYDESPVVVDGRIITANGPQSAKDFAQTIVEKLTAHD